MSAFYVGSKSISRLANDLVVWLIDEPKELATKLYAMNRRALIARYGSDGITDMIESFEYDEKATFGDDDEQKLQSLRCYLYQCGEGDIPESKLFRELENIKTKLEDLVAKKYLIKRCHLPLRNGPIAKVLAEIAIADKSWE